MHVRLPAALALSTAVLGACAKASDLDTNIMSQTDYAQVRLLILLPDASSLGAFVDVPNDLPTTWFLASAGPGVTEFEGTIVHPGEKPWVLYVTNDEASIGSYDVPQPDGGFVTLIVAPQTSQGSSGPLAFGAAPLESPTQPPASDVALVDVISGVPGLAGGTVDVGSTTVPGGLATAQPLGTLLTLPPGTVSITATPPVGSPVTFTNVPLAAGELTTLAFAGLETSSMQLIVVADTFTSTGQQTITESAQVLSPAP